MRRIWENPIIFGLILLAALGLVFYMLLGRKTANVLVEQMMHREQAITRAGAASIESFLVLAGRSLSLVSANRAVISFRSDADEVLSGFVERWRGTPILGASMVDEKGVVRLTVNQDGSKAGIGRSVADRDYFLKAVGGDQSKIIIGQVVISRVGQSTGRFVAPLVAPIRDAGGTFKGLIISSAVLEELTKYYLDPLKISDQTGVHLITNEGVVLYSTSGPAIGDNILEYIDKHKFLGSGVLVERVKQDLKKAEEGKLDLVWPSNRGWQRYLVAWSPIKIEEGRFWYLVLTTPVEDALAFVGPLYMRVLVTFAVVFLVLLAYAVRLARHFASDERRKYEHVKHGIKE